MITSKPARTSCFFPPLGTFLTPDLSHAVPWAHCFCPSASDMGDIAYHVSQVFHIVEIQGVG